eukprot:COSAG01_NODE_21322_length_907_cov_1.426980_1_plen_77_part_00
MVEKMQCDYITVGSGCAMVLAGRFGRLHDAATNQKHGFQIIRRALQETNQTPELWGFAMAASLWPFYSCKKNLHTW